MHRYVNCIVHNSSEGNLLIGETHTALFDCGMAFCADETMRTVQTALQGRTLDYIFLSHTHYDHIGALPFFRERWPRARVVTSEAGAAVLLKDTPRRVIRELSFNAAETLGIVRDLSYSDEHFRADIIVKDGDTVPLGGVSVEVLETPGHTRDSLCFFVPELALLILCETPGVMMPDGTVYPCYLTSYDDTLRSIEKCRRKQYEVLSLPHRGIVEAEISEGFFDKALASNAACRDFILSIKDRSEDEMLDAFYNEYASEILLTFQPIEAFYANARATINCTLRAIQ
jgi:glyoxylase-like metal-dependent hydrolase (beta-lactamase superfamily II)